MEEINNLTFKQIQQLNLMIVLKPFFAMDAAKLAHYSETTCIAVEFYYMYMYMYNMYIFSCIQAWQSFFQKTFVFSLWEIQKM